LGREARVDPRRALPPLPRGAHRVLILSSPPAAGGTGTSQRDAGACARCLAAATERWSAELRPAGLVVAGGATARCLFERLGASGVHLLGEVAPGIPRGRVVGGVWADVPIVTKAGGFGAPNALLDAVRALGVSSTAEMHA
jgi:uncharacterized protein YgbK (DUF1537 family)